MVDGPEGAEGAAFAQALMALKERGSNLLVVGGSVDGIHTDACDRLLGDDSERPRRRVHVRTDGTVDCAPGGRPSDGRSRVLVRETATRGATTASASADRAGQLVSPGADELAASVEDAVADLEPTAGYHPAQLRVCFDSLLPLFSEYDDQQVSRTLSTVTDRVEQVDGMGHYHLPVARDHRTVDLLEPLFDAVIVLRASGGRPEHNWQLVGRDVESGWLPL